MRLYSPADLVTLGLERSRVLMINEAHDGLRRCIRTRRVGRSILPVAHQLGVRHLAMEALYPGFAREANTNRRVPPAVDGYLGQPEMRNLIGTALDLGWTLIAYEPEFGAEPPQLRALDPMSIDRTNWRELEQARGLQRALAQIPGNAPLLVWCGNGHLVKVPVGDWLPMGLRFREVTAIEAFAIDQITTVCFDTPSRRDLSDRLVAKYGAHIEAAGDAVGLLAQDEPLLDRPHGVDAYLFSLDNELE